MYIGIESSCDETSIAILESKSAIDSTSFDSYINSFNVLSSIVSSQIDTHSQFGGVVPEIGARKHAESIHLLFMETVRKMMGDVYKTKDIYKPLSQKEKKRIQKVQGIFVTTEPGLVSALRVGEEFSKTLQYFILSTTGKFVPIVHINHLRGHIASSMYKMSKDQSRTSEKDENIFPHVHLLVSGGNTQLVELQSWNTWNIIGQTLDDAAGESLDKIGRMVGLPYPAGVYISKIAGLTDENPLQLPEGMKQSKSYDYSFSGLKTAVRYHVQRLSHHISDLEFEKPLTHHEIDILTKATDETIHGISPRLTYIREVCISAQSVVVKQLITKFSQAVKDINPKSVGLSGGVSANMLLRKKLSQIAQSKSIHVYVPHFSLTGDNAIMIVLAGLANGYKKI